jgi:threonine dehydratase
VIKVSFDEWWQAFAERSFAGVEGTFIHSFDDPQVMAGNGTIRFRRSWKTCLTLMRS